MSTRLTIILSQIQQVAAEQKKTLAPMTDDLSLLDSGLDSLCFAILVARLEDIIGVDPFTRVRRRQVSQYDWRVDRVLRTCRSLNLCR